MQAVRLTSVLIFAMDIIHHCLSLAPVPGLSAAFAILRYIGSSVQQVQASRRQIIALAAATAELVKTLNVEYAAGRILPDNSVEALDKLQR